MKTPGASPTSLSPIIFSKDYFQLTTVTPPGGQALTWRGAIIAWLTGAPVSVVDTHPSTLSVCAPPVDNGE